MNISQIRYVVAVCEQRSFSLAAKELHVTVQAVSKAIGDLEHELNRKLFERTSRGAVPTPTGSAFCEKARPALLAFAELEAFATLPEPEPAASNQSFRLLLCAPRFQGNEGLRAAISKLVGTNTGMDIDFSLSSPDAALAELERGTADAMVTIGRYERKNVTCSVTGTLPTGIVIARSHPLADRDCVSVADLSRYPAGMSPTWDGFNESIQAMYEKRNLLGEVRIIDDQNDMPQFLASGGYYFSALIPMTQDPALPAVVKAIDPRECLNVPICIVAPKGQKSAKVDALKQFLLKMLQRANGGTVDAGGN